MAAGISSGAFSGSGCSSGFACISKTDICSISIQGSTLTLTWNSYEGQTYTVRAATTLDAFEDYIPVDGEGLDNLGYYHMPATPPYNSAMIDLEGANARFFKIRVDNLADEAR